jgi:hypothetical protein
MQPPLSESEAVIRLQADRAHLGPGARHLAPTGVHVAASMADVNVNTFIS